MISVALLMSVALLSSCASLDGFPERSEHVEQRLARLQELYFLPTTDVREVYSGKPTDSEKRRYRDDVAYGRMEALDLQFSIFRAAIYGEGAGSNLALDILGVAAGGAGAAVTGVDASRVLSALSGGISGTRTAINQNLYYERTMPALMALMEAERAKVKAEIIDGLQQNISIYPLGQALVDLERYYQAGSIPGALVSITTTAGKAQTAAQEALSTARAKAFVDTTAQETVSNLLDGVAALPVGGAWAVLDNPPSDIDDYTLDMVRRRLGGTELHNAAGRLSGPSNDAAARAILKMVIVSIGDRSPDNLAKWRAAIKAQQ